MLSPSIDNFKEPESLFQVEKIKGNVPLDSRYISNFYFSHFVSITIPETLMIPDSLTSNFTSQTEYYKVSNLHIDSFINEIFLKSFVSNGKLTLLSINTRIDCDNCIAITPKGELILNSDKDTYHSLGIDGKMSHFGSKVKNRYVVTINLKDTDLQSSTSKLLKLKNRLKILEAYTVILYWEPHEKTICPSSIAKYIYDLGHDITVCHTNFNSFTSYNVKVPVIEIDKVEKDEIVDFMEWLGMVSLEGDLETDNSSDYVNSYTTPVPNVEIGQVKCLQWRGLFTSDHIQELISRYIAYNEQNKKPWVSIYVQGFSDAPLAWGNEEQNFFTNGDNSYTIIFDQSNCLFCIQKTSRKRYK